MKVFLSWAGEQSKHVAQTLYTWLPQVIQTLEPWFSPRMSKGDAWDGAIADGLDQSPIGIIVLTPESLESKYLHYEAGAIANVKGAKPCTLLIGLKPSDVKQPLGRFQHTIADHKDVLLLLKTINEKIGEVGEKPLAEDKLIKAFEMNWPELKEAIDKAPVEQPKQKKRGQDDILEEVLLLSRASFEVLQGITSSKVAYEAPTKRTLMPIGELEKFIEEYHQRFPNKFTDGDYLTLLRSIHSYIATRARHYRVSANTINEILKEKYLPNP
jgi:hypothetical protein